jgi:aspartate aminotransferase-like enzyme
MGYNAETKNVLHFLTAFEEVLRNAGLRLPPRAGVEAAARLTSQ